MVYKRSEYGQQFKVTSLVKNIPVYKENVNYRHQRRELECAHTPISWDPELTESEESDEKVSPDADEADKLPIKDIQIIDEDDENVESDADSVEKEKKDAQDADKKEDKEDDDKAEVEITQQSEQLRKAARLKLNQYISKENKAEETIKETKGKPANKLAKTYTKPSKTSEDVFKKRIKPRRPDRLQEIPKAHPTSAPAERPANRSDTRSPFIAYGCGGQERSLGEKKTFNIRASSAVYPAAMRAKKRNQLIIEKLREKQKTATAREKRKQALFNARLARETASWDTEYRRSYSAYEDTEYSTNDREPRKMKSYFVK